MDGALEWTSEILQTYEPVEGSFSRWGSTQRAARQISKPHTQDITYFENSEGIGSLKQSFKGQISALVNLVLPGIASMACFCLSIVPCFDPHSDRITGPILGGQVSHSPFPSEDTACSKCPTSRPHCSLASSLSSANISLTAPFCILCSAGLPKANFSASLTPTISASFPW